MSVLTIVQRTCALLGLAQPTAVVSSTDNAIQTLFECLREEASDLASACDWQILRKESTFTTTATVTQTGAVPSDWDRFINDSFFNRTKMRKVFGPITPQTWQAIQAMPQLNTIYLAWVQRNGSFLMTPTPSAGDTIAYEYISNQWAASNASVPQSDFLADTDTTVLSESLMRLGTRWRFREAKGFDYGRDYDTYIEQREQVISRDGGNAVIDTTGKGYNWGSNVPEGNFPSS